MKTYRKELYIQTPTRRAFVNITNELEKALKESNIYESSASWCLYI